ncbi:D-alanyl-D-alanine carboxypeptidase/D-alanyl-D-alanine-endopeptidase [Nodosilinea sp. P-1105]|uniref:D-alanyl-D-alanine carboxypeptidase/D-alanyl-D-alanine endopeptidase n=1 Tax=Nodosilinea sp. P-1105 TaxID=2546229 RepID=UPI001469F049|nr:D-alanyl-D-alanine carboxypeptidase/D-alanyl-D-alanine-endopeptidase [Nodosilinea sp. P-1105]
MPTWPIPPRFSALPLGLAGLLITAVPGQAQLCPAQLRPAIDQVLSQAPLDTAHVGILLQTQAQSAGDRRTLYDRQSQRLFTPASNVKLLTTAAALHHLGPDHRWQTTVTSTPGPGELAVLQVSGQGDPTLTENQLQSLAQQLYNQGITQVSRLVLDDSYFPGPATNPTWEWGDAQFAYGAPANSLILNQNARLVEVTPTQVGQPLEISWPDGQPPWPTLNYSRTVATTDAAEPVRLWRAGHGDPMQATGQMAVGAAPRRLNLAVLNPAQQFGVALRQALEAESITVLQTLITTTTAPSPGDPLATLQSPPLVELLVPTNQDSNNLYAEVLLNTLGVTYGSDRPNDATQAGTAAVKALLADLGVNSAPLRLADGSGLSRHNLVTPVALVETLQVMAYHPDAAVFQDSLAVAGVSGTLRNRLTNTPLQNRVQGKTGALTGNVSLSGYVQPPNYDPLVFSMVINQANQHASTLRQGIDEVLLLLGQLSREC